ncbi:ABC transporter [Capsaspora owczarzaki ATCC 30864]|uniref:ABC transporter n=1 Tax=Capsaspora owczarzaki (strain ATCC 30864) TaxID=595528 RepID=A0A0D2VSN8_CAPO3|nr:ABC transporter [Capsaspora owczarzaki ATCC 30864]KJE94122.1 ABC transporter [Capsaspora owczarzaki ATCC 30864]|eukprot:XP_004347561.1 ABC transporter [Capsaspora owczarzaki ATCC 30864]
MTEQSVRVPIRSGPSDVISDNDDTTPLLSSGATSPTKFSASYSRAVKRIPAYFTFSNVSYEIQEYKTVQDKALRLVGQKSGTTKRILHNVYGMVKPGETLAIMGPSGSGKTTLLDILADRKAKVHGNILLNGAPRNRIFKRLSGYVLQQDILIGHLTVREVLTFAAELRLDSYMLKSDRARRVQEVIDELKLTKVADSYIGTASHRGLSGGERKRVSVGVELITNPSLLFLDEFTTGLDSKTALTLMETLQELARNGNRAIVFTIHQPRSNITKLFDKLLLLADGRQIFYGNAPEALPFFEGCGFMCDVQTNPSDFFLDIIADDTEAVHKLSTTYAQSSQSATIVEELRRWESVGGSTNVNGTNSSSRAIVSQYSSAGYQQLLSADQKDQLEQYDANARHIPQYAAPFHRQVWTLLRREVLSTVRNMQVFWAQLLQAIAFGCIMGSLWSNNNTNPDLGNTSVIFFVCSYLSMMAFMAAPHLISFRQNFFHERSSGSYRASSYMISKTLVDFPFYAIIALAFSGIVFKFSAMPNDTFPFYLLTCILVVFTASSVITFVGSIAPVVEVAMVGATLINGLSMTACGFLVARPNLPSYWVWLYESSYIHHGFASLFLNLFGEGSPQALFQFGSDQPLNRWEGIWVLPLIAVAFRFLTYLALRRKHE